MNKQIVLLTLMGLSIFSLEASSKWIEFRNQTVEQSTSVSGWCSQNQALVMMDLIHKYKCRCVVEIGVFRGSSLFPIAQAVKYNRSGQVYGIDAWSRQEAVQGIMPDDSAYQWWMQLDMNVFYLETVEMVARNHLQKYCTLIRKPANQAVKMFKNQSIDFIHFDGTRHEELAYQEIVNYFPKIKNGGLIVLKDPMIRTMKQALVFLLERSDIVTSFEPTVSYLVLRKNKKRSETVHELQLR